MVRDFTGTRALVTGAGGGIGRGIADVLAERGASVAINDIELDRAAEAADALQRTYGGSTVAVQGDVSKRPDVERMFEAASAELGPIDILVNNAGIETIVPFLEITDDQWTRLIDVNLRGAWLCSQVFCRRVVAERRPASIVHIGSIQAGKVLPGRTHYAPSKLALDALTRNMSAEMTPHGIRVNCIHPGLVDTPMTAWIMKDAEVMPKILAQISVGRAGQPREIGTVAAFLASPDASYLTGQSIYVDGGWQGK
jgi:NAD(P)-dependent dehydrogenase (short-subunit alcohol dehydrogenase family)